MCKAIICILISIQLPSVFALITRPPINLDSINRDLLSRCEERYRDTPLDHFSWANDNVSFKQRYYICDRHNYKQKDGAIFFYLGNEANVQLYLNNTGLMWEQAPHFNALLIFAEHRYYGESLPFHHHHSTSNSTNTTNGRAQKEHMQYLTSEQAMADYATLIYELKQELQDPSVPVIGFGGSYGGMLATWFRLKYPHLMDGCIAGSAPIWTYYGEDPPADTGSFAAIVTHDASAKGGGSAAACSENVRAAWSTMFEMGGSKGGRKDIAEAMRLCSHSEPGSKEDVVAIAEWAQGAWDYLAMGNYPYPSGYILNGDGELPAFPVRAACMELSEPDLKGKELLSALANAVGVFFNHTGEVPCFDTVTGPNKATSEVEDYWSFQWCTEQFMPQTRDGVKDMFWPQPFEEDKAIKYCQTQWSVTPDPLHATIEWGGRDIKSASNMVFSNGGFDPWSGGGVLEDISDTLVSVFIPEGAHHLDLMFSHELDPQSVIQARKVEAVHIGRWIEEKRARGVGVKGGRRGQGVLGRSGGNIHQVS